MKKYDDVLIRKLATSRDDAKSSSKLADELGITQRDLLKQVHDLRQQGIPILADKASKGYWIAKDASEIRTWIRQSESSAKDIFKTTGVLAKIADALEDNQISMI